MKIPRIPQDDIDLVGGSEFFDADWYRREYPDVAALRMDPVEHFLWLGHRIGRNPSTKFSCTDYLHAHWDIKRAGLNPLVHYLRSGIKEGRLIYPLRSSEGEGGESKCHRKVCPRHLEKYLDRHQGAVNRLTSAENIYSDDLVSVIMPTLNRGSEIKRAISSVLAQTHQNIELIIVDDGSEDDTSKVVSSFDDARIIFTSNCRKQGVSGARNTGLDKAFGKWIFFLDSDNTWRRDVVDFLLRHADLSRTSSGYCAAHVHDDNRATKFVLYEEFDYESCLRENFIDLNCFFLRWAGPFRDFRFDENLRRLVDWDFILRTAAATRVVGVPFIGVDYYDGSAARITNQEATSSGAIAALLEQVRDKAREEIVSARTIRDASSYRVAVIFHVYHPERVEECLMYLDNLKFDYDLFVTTSLDEDSACLDLVRERHPKAKIFFFPNVGTDLGPFLELVSTVKNHQLVLKIHTKRDVEPWGDAWRRGLMQPILGSPQRVADIVSRFRKDEKIVMACSADFYKLGLHNTIPPTMRHLQDLAGTFELDHLLVEDWAFVAGTMFWIRPQLLVQAARNISDTKGYSATFIRDGALEHGIERLLGLLLWQDQENKVAVVSMDGNVEEVPLGQGYSTEGVSHTMKKLHQE